MVESNATPALGSIRISRLTDDTSSPERQRADLKRQPGVRYVKITEDLDVSATTHSPFKRQGIGEWLTDPQKLAQYDEVIVWKLDRFCRKASDMRDMMKWADDTGKRLVFQQDHLTYDPSATGLAKVMNDTMISLVAAFAEMEALNTSVRVRNLHSHLRNKRSWSGGPLPLGYAVVREGERKVLVPHAEALEVFDEIADRLIAGESNNAIASDLNKRGVLSPSDWSRRLQGKDVRGSAWSGQSIVSQFKFDTPLGYLMKWDAESKQRIPHRDDDGEPIQAWEPLITPERLRDVRKALAAKATASRPHVEWTISPLLDVAKCYDCKTNLSRMQKPGSKHVYLRCYKAYAVKEPCGARGMIPMRVAWSLLEDRYVRHHGDEPVVEQQYVKAARDTARLDELRSDYDAVASLFASQRSASARERLQRKLDSLDAAMGELEEQVAGSGKWEVTELGETNRERWLRSDEAGRREMMIKAGVELHIKREQGTDNYYSRIYLPGVDTLDIELPYD